MSFLNRLPATLRRRRKELLAAALLAGVSFAHPAFALQPGEVQHLTNYGPLDANGALVLDPQTLFPGFFEDFKGVALQLCTAKTDLLGLCLFTPVTDAIPNLPLQQQTGFGDEAFWFNATATFNINMPGCQGCGKGLVLMAVEAAYTTGDPVDGAQFTFGRIRMFIDAPVAGRYRITYPFGVKDVTVDAPGTRAINITNDVGTSNPDYTGPLRSDIGAFLTWDPNIAPAAPAGYVGDPNVLHEFVGATYTRPGDTAPFNKVQFEYLGPLDGDVNGTPQAELDLGAGPGQPIVLTQIAISGQNYSGVIPAPLTATRATYASGRAEIVAEAAPDANVTVSFDNGATQQVLAGDGLGDFYLVTPMTSMPATAVLTATQANHTTTSITATVTDAIFIQSAQFDPVAHSLAVTALSGLTPPPTLTVLGAGNVALGTMTASTTLNTTNTSQLTFSATGIPVGPAEVAVTSSSGGSAHQLVQFLNPSDAGTPTPTPTPTPSAQGPTANPDSASVPEGTPFVINVAQNDAPVTGTTLNLNSITVVTQPALGTIGLIGPAGITYTPGPTFKVSDPPLTDSFTYEIADSAGNFSAPATVTVNVIPATLTPSLTQFVRNGSSWRVRGTTNGIANMNVRATLVEKLPGGTVQSTLIGSAPILAGAFDIRSNTPTLSQNCINGNNTLPPTCSVTLDDDAGKVTGGIIITIK